MDTEQNASELAARNEELDARNRAEVVLNVYDLCPALNFCCYWFRFGIYHSAIQVHDREYAFAPHNRSDGGIYKLAPRGHAYLDRRCSIRLGYTNKQPSEFQTFMGQVSLEYPGNTYNFLTRNCNHFTDDMARRLTGNGIPEWINRLPQVCQFCSFFLKQRLQAPRGEFVMPDGSIEELSELSSIEAQQTHNENEDADQNIWD